MTAAAMLCLLAALAPAASAQAPTPSPTPAAASCAPVAPCTKLAPRLIQLSVLYKKGDQPLQQDDKVTQLARKRFYLSSCPFNLDKIQGAGTAPTRRAYYTSVKASPQLIKWLEDNNCDTIYCRELRKEEVECPATNTACVPEFVRAYNEALKKLKNDAARALRWVTNYEPLSAPELRIGFYTAKAKWLDAMVKSGERASGLPAGTIRTAMTDRRGVAYFYDLCPGTYYISNVAPLEVEGEAIIWETTAITVKGPKAGEPDQLSVTSVFLANVQSKKKRANFFVGKKVSAASTSSAQAIDGKAAGQ
jgi:hypothetical protein